MTILLDTNVLLRAADPADARYQTANDAIAVLRGNGHDVALVPQNVYEFWVVSTRPVAQNGRGLSPAAARRELATIETDYAVLHDTADVYREWKRLIAAHAVSGKPAHDARLVAAMLVHGIAHLLTFNPADFARYPAVVPLTPAGVLAVPP